MREVDSVKQSEYYLVERSLLPEVFQKVVEANAALKTGRAKTAAEAAQAVGLSRSAFYKYKDGVRPFYEAASGRVITFHLMLSDQPGVLSSLLQQLAQSGANLLTINQSIPMSGQASVTIAARTDRLSGTVEELLTRAGTLEGVQRIEIVASE
ncbi:MAG: ACT domain-containing protein [Clostridiaceae bacterium]|nr:ACT domain-containing protein [Clostridiaceae bacterium]